MLTFKTRMSPQIENKKSELIPNCLLKKLDTENLNQLSIFILNYSSTIHEIYRRKAWLEK